MSTLFFRVLDISMMAAWLILAILVWRLLLHKAPKWCICALWSLVAVRLLVPFTIESPLSLLPRTGFVLSEANRASEAAAATEQDLAPAYITEDPVLISAPVADAPVIATPSAKVDQAPAKLSMQGILGFLRANATLLSILWLIGACLMFFQAMLRYIRLKKSVSVFLEPSPEGYSSLAENLTVRECDEVKTPFLLGVFRPIVYVPANLDQETLRYVLLHETAHLKRRDHWWKPLGYVLLSVYWFHPLCWVAYLLFCRDVEAACDEKVVQDLDHGGIAAYSEALLACAVPRRNVTACPLAFGETNVKNRIKNILNYKKPAFWLTIGAIAVLVILAICFLTNPKSSKEEGEPTSQEGSVSVSSEEGSQAQVTSSEGSSESTSQTGTETGNPSVTTDPVTTTTDIEEACLKASVYYVPVGSSFAPYEIVAAPAKKVTKKDLLAEFREDPLGSGRPADMYDHAIYSLEEYPDLDLLYVTVTNVKDGDMNEVYIAPKKAVKLAGATELEDAIADGVYVQRQGQAYANKDALTRFYEDSLKGVAGSLIIGNYYAMPSNVSKEFYDAYKDDYPVMYYDLLSFDGTQFTLSPVHKIDGEYVIHEEPGVDSPASTWKYLMHYEGIPREGSVPSTITYYDRYVLMDDNTLTWDEIELDRLDGITIIRTHEISREYFEDR